MTIDKHREADILRYHHVEGWGVHTIAAQLGIHHDTVNRVLAQAGLPRVKRLKRPCMIEPYLPFIQQTLEKHPRLTAARLYHMVTSRGYAGGPSQFRAWVAEMRPRPTPEAYLRLRTLKGEQGQVDWGAFGDVNIGKAKRPLVGFVMVLSWSRAIFLRFYLNQRMESFLHGHQAAFEAWGGLPRILLYDNLKSAVLERHGDAIRFHPTLLALSEHYGFEPRPVAVARGNEKGRVERAIRYIRDSFFAGRQWTDLEDLNAQARQWCEGVAAERACPDNTHLRVRDALEEERPRLLTLPDNPFAGEELVPVSVAKTPYVRFDLNDYSVPHTHVRRTVTISASMTQVRVLDGTTVIASHRRSYDKGARIEDPDHLQALVAYKREARQHRGVDRLSHAIPLSEDFLQQAALRQYRPGVVVNQLLSLLDDYGAQELALAMQEALERGVPHPNAVRQSLERRREQRQEPPPLPVVLSHAKARVTIPPVSLSGYDQLQGDHDAAQESRHDHA